MGTTPRFLEAVETLHPYFEKAFAPLAGEPEFHTVSLDVAISFAESHGSEGIDSLSDSEIEHLCVLLEGLTFPIHPSEMARTNKYGCNQCRVFYEALWEERMAGYVARVEEGHEGADLTPDLLAKATEMVAESEKFLER